MTHMFQIEQPFAQEHALTTKAAQLTWWQNEILGCIDRQGMFQVAGGYQ